jgi:hypothetical protein
VLRGSRRDYVCVYRVIEVFQAPPLAMDTGAVSVKIAHRPFVGQGLASTIRSKGALTPWLIKCQKRPPRLRCSPVQDFRNCGVSRSPVKSSTIESLLGTETVLEDDFYSATTVFSGQKRKYAPLYFLKTCPQPPDGAPLNPAQSQR